MKKGIQEYKYIKQQGGRGRYAVVKLEVKPYHSGLKITEDYKWSQFQQYNKWEKEPVGILEIKANCLNCLKDVYDTFFSNKNMEIIIHDVEILVVDTIPAHICAALTIGLFDLLGETLNSKEVKSIDEYVSLFNVNDKLPDFKKLAITIRTQNPVGARRSH